MRDFVLLLVNCESALNGMRVCWLLQEARHPPKRLMAAGLNEFGEEFGDEVCYQYPCRFLLHPPIMLPRLHTFLMLAPLPITWYYA
jgi:hypothetical protein